MQKVYVQGALLPTKRDVYDLSHIIILTCRNRNWVYLFIFWFFLIMSSRQPGNDNLYCNDQWQACEFAVQGRHSSSIKKCLEKPGIVPSTVLQSTVPPLLEDKVSPLTIFLGKEKTIWENQKSSILFSENLADFRQYFNLAPRRGLCTYFSFDNPWYMCLSRKCHCILHTELWLPLLTYSSAHILP